MESSNNQKSQLANKGTMKRWILKCGSTDLNGLILEEAPIPQPGPGQVRVKIHAASINYRDQLILTGQYGQAVTKNIIPLSDGAGEIDALGEDVHEWAVGDHVVTIYAFEKWSDGPPVPGLDFGLGSNSDDGVLAEYVLLNAKRITNAPKSLTMVEAATLPCAGLTAWTALNGDRPYKNPLLKGEKILILGTGGVSLFALKFAKEIGAEVFGTSSSNDKLERLKEIGAADVINYKETQNWGEEAFKLTGGVARVINSAGGSAMEQSFAAVGYGGEVAYMGLFDQASAVPNFMFLMMKGASLRGTAVGSGAAFKDLIKFIDEKQIKPPIDRVFDFADAKLAYQAGVSPELFGKIVIKF